MEEKKIQHYDCFFDREPSKSNLKPFDLEAAKAGKPVYTRDGRKARIICFDAKRKDGKNIVALIPSKEYPGFEDLVAYPNNGNYHGGHENDGDLMMLPEKKEGCEDNRGLLHCNNCGGTNILKHAWVDANTLEFAQEDWANNEYWCEDCNEIVDIAEEEETNESNKDIC